MSNIRNVLAATALISTGHAFAASSVDLIVKGSITPSACEVSLSNGGHFDIGKLAAKDLYPDGPTELPLMKALATTHCESATLLALEARDNRAGSAYDDDEYTFGLGLVNGTEKVGFLTTGLRSHVADGVQSYSINSSDGGLTWANGGTFKSKGNLVSVYQGETAAPVPVQVLVSDLWIAPYIAPANSLTLTSEVPIDGSITLTVRYL